MAVFETWLKSDLKKPVVVQKLSGNLFSADNGGNLIGVEVMDNGSPATLTGGVTGYIIREDGGTVTVSGTLSGNKASIVLPASAYVTVGHISIVVKVSTTTVGACVGYVYRTTTDTLIDPGHVIPSVEELLAKIADCEQATENANTAADNADEKATLANNAATSANTAATKINNMTVSATKLAPGSTPTATISEVSGHKHIAFGMVTGDTGAKGDKGDKGDTGTTPAFTIGTVTDVPHGTPSSATITGTPENPVLNLNLQVGESGNETIDDTAGKGDTDLVWSADKLSDKFDSKANAIVLSDDTPESIKTIDNGAKDIPMTVKVGIEPVQDLHGYDSPWPAGGGKNLLNQKLVQASSSQVLLNGDISTAGDNKVTLTGGVTYTISFKRPTSKAYGLYCGADNTAQQSLIATNSSSTSVQFTPSETDNFVFWLYKSSGVETTDVADVMIEVGSSATDYAPYSNICPISGWTGCNVTRTGKNLFTNNTFQQGGIDTNGNNSDAVGTYNQRVRTVGFIPLRSGTYTVSSAGEKRIYLRIYDTYGNFLSALSNELMPMTFTLSNDSKIRFALANSDTSTNITPSDVSNIQIESGSTATSYEPFGTTYPITFPSSAGTVYGGELTVNKDGTGTLVPNSVAVDMGDFDYDYDSTYQRFITHNFVDSRVPNTSRAIKCICSAYECVYNGRNISEVKNGQFYFASRKLVFHDNTLNDASAFKTVRTGEKVVYPLDGLTPITLTAPQVRSLLGINNIFADTGKINELQYSADTKMYVDAGESKQEQINFTRDMIAYTEPDASTRSYSAWSMIVHNDALYQATESISIGEELIENQNIKEASLNSILGLSYRESVVQPYETMQGDSFMDIVTIDRVGRLRMVNAMVSPHFFTTGTLLSGKDAPAFYSELYFPVRYIYTENDQTITESCTLKYTKSTMKWELIRNDGTTVNPTHLDLYDKIHFYAIWFV